MKPVIQFLALAVSGLALTGPAMSQVRHGHGHSHRQAWSASSQGISFNPSSERLKQFAKLIESQGNTTVVGSSHCEPGLGGFYAPSQNKITICLNNQSSTGDVLQTLLHEGVHRAQHCRGWGSAFSSKTEVLEAFRKLPKYHQEVVATQYDDAYAQVEEVEARLLSIDGGKISHVEQEYYFFNLAKACGGNWARGLSDFGEFQECMGNRTGYMKSGKKCPS
uniref:hypothetical protein n=1 Tax=Synechococcus sp. UW106 TaxID=368495 RepID=UPI001A7E05F6|nr:hypothetical protein [Synechococcus sp. UW106]